MAGRPRDRHIDEAVLAATLDVLTDTRYAELTFDEVARRAGVHRPAIYRRWPDKAHLVTAAITPTLGARPTPNTGDLRRDLGTGIAGFERAFRTGPLRNALLPLAIDLAAHPELRETFFADVFRAWRATSQTAIEQAIDRGEVDPHLDMQFLLDALAAPFYYRALFEHAPINRTLVTQTVDLVLAGIRTSRG